MADIQPSIINFSTPVQNEKRRWIIAIDGTWADQNRKGGSTVIDDLQTILGRADKNQIVRYVEGIGTSASIVENLHGGLTGLGIDQQIRRAYRDLVKNWNEGDEIVIAGYSRGAYEAIILADLISSVGIPQGKPSARKIYKRYKHGHLVTRSQWNGTSDDFKCKPATIQALALFDAVSSLGVPKTGVLSFLSLFSSSRKTVVSSLRRVRNIFHALAINEYRQPYSPHIIHLPSINTYCNLEQVWFNGSHHDLGKEERHHGGLVDTPLAWMISKLHNIGIKVNDNELSERFPSYNPTIHATLPPNMNADTETREWAHQNIHPTFKGLSTLMGYKARTPGRYLKSSTEKTNEFVHISVRDRSFAAPGQNRDVLPGLRYIRCIQDNDSLNSQGTWSEVGSRSGSESRVVLMEAILDHFEASLQGFSLA